MTPRYLVVGAVLLTAVLCASPSSSFAQASSDRQQEFMAHVQKAQEYLHEKRPDLAIPELEAAAALKPDDLDTQANLGVLLFFQGKPTDAIPHLQAALQQQPSLAKIRGILGIAEVQTGSASQGRTDLQTAFSALSEDKFRVQVGLELVTSYTATGDLDQAATVLTQLKAIAPDNPEVLYAAYRTYSDLSSESRLALALRAPDSAQMHQLLAHEEIKEGNTNGAIAEYRKAIALDPRLPSVHLELAELLDTSPDPAIKKQAVQEFEAALAQNPRDAKALCGLAQVALQKSNVQLASDDYEKAIAAAPWDSDAKLGLADILIGKGEQNKALPLLEQAVQLEPTNALAHYHLAMLYRRMGHEDQAKREVELFKQYKQMKENLRAVYKDLLVQPQEIRGADEAVDGK